MYGSTDAKNINAATVVRLIVLVIAFANLILSLFTDFRIPGLSAEEQESLAVAVTMLVSGISYWYNNSWSKNATVADKVLGVLKNTDLTIDDVMGAIENVQADVDSRKNSRDAPSNNNGGYNT